jgi:hypothetical protein
MCRAWNLRSVCRQFLLVATAIQGLTPDLNTVSSAWLLSWLGRVVTHDVVVFADLAHVLRGDRAVESDAASSRPSPSDDDFQEELPDEVCGPADSTEHVLVGRKFARTPHLDRCAIDSSARRARSTALRRFLCRMTC